MLFREFIEILDLDGEDTQPKLFLHNSFGECYYNGNLKEMSLIQYLELMNITITSISVCHNKKQYPIEFQIIVHPINQKYKK